MRSVDEARIAATGETRFRSEYDYAVFEYWRSAKVIRALERAGVEVRGRVLDDGCGGGGTALSLAEDAKLAVGLDLHARFRDAGIRLRQERATDNAGFVQADATALPFRSGCFDLVFSHSVIEHVASAEAYLAECVRVLQPGGVLYISTAPYLSFAGAHLPRLRLPIPIHLLLGRRIAFALFKFLARRAAWTLRERREANTFIKLAEEGREKEDDLLELVTVARLTGWIERSGLRLRRQERYVTGFFRAFPGPLRRVMERTPWIQDVMIGNIQSVLEKP